MTVAAPYSTPFDVLIRRLKFQGATPIATALASLLIQTLDQPANSSPFLELQARPRPRKTDVIIPIPLHWSRQWKRGFNQAALIAQTLSQHFDIPIHHALSRSRRTLAQSQLETRQRRANLHNAFKLELPVQGKHCLLVDDVVTTAATVDSATTVLVAAGAGSVHIAACARTLGRRPTHVSGGDNRHKKASGSFLPEALLT